MDTRSSTQVFGITADHEVAITHHMTGANAWACLRLPGEITLFFEGEGDDNLYNVMGFLEWMCSIRNTLLQDWADRQAVAP
jgi:hypothetical protein